MQRWIIRVIYFVRGRQSYGLPIFLISLNQIKLNMELECRGCKKIYEHRNRLNKYCSSGCRAKRRITNPTISCYDVTKIIMNYKDGRDVVIVDNEWVFSSKISHWIRGKVKRNVKVDIN